MEDQRAVSMVEGTIGALWRDAGADWRRYGRRRAQTAMGGPRTCLADGNTMSLASACRFRSLSCALARQTMARNASAPRCRYHWARPYDMWRGQGDARFAQDSTWRRRGGEGQGTVRTPCLRRLGRLDEQGNRCRQAPNEQARRSCFCRPHYRRSHNRLLVMQMDDERSAILAYKAVVWVG